MFAAIGANAYGCQSVQGRLFVHAPLVTEDAHGEALGKEGGFGETGYRRDAGFSVRRTGENPKDASLNTPHMSKPSIALAKDPSGITSHSASHESHRGLSRPG